MAQRSVTHATFVIERSYDAAPATRLRRVVRSRGKRALVRRAGGVGAQPSYALDFRVGGREHSSGGPKGGPSHSYDAIYQDIVPNERIIISYDMHLDGRHISVSLATVELKPSGKGTRLTFTEQGAFLDGYDDAGSREQGSRGPSRCARQSAAARCSPSLAGEDDGAEALLSSARLVLLEGACRPLRERHAVRAGHRRSRQRRFARGLHKGVAARQVSR